MDLKLSAGTSEEGTVICAEENWSIVAKVTLTFPPWVTGGAIIKFLIPMIDLKISSVLVKSLYNCKMLSDILSLPSTISIVICKFNGLFPNVNWMGDIVILANSP